MVDNCGTFFGTDAAAPRLQRPSGGRRPRPATGRGQTTPATCRAIQRAGTDDAYIPRVKDNDARDSGQYGLALRWFVPEFNDTEFGAYAMNYHSRSPYLSITAIDRGVQTVPTRSGASQRRVISSTIRKISACTA